MEDENQVHHDNQEIIEEMGDSASKNDDHKINYTADDKTGKISYRKADTTEGVADPTELDELDTEDGMDETGTKDTREDIQDETESENNSNSNSEGLADSNTATDNSQSMANNDSNKSNGSNLVSEGIDKQNFGKHRLMQNGICLKGNVCVIYQFLFVRSSFWNLIDNKKTVGQAKNITVKTLTEYTENLLGELEEQPRTADVKDDTIKATTVNSTVDKKPANKTSLDIKQVEELLGKKKVGYALKIQEIELQLLKLENRLLTETLSQQNNSASYTRLENLILKLENELLKINRSFSMIQEENNQLKAKQLSEEQIYDIFNKAKEENKAVEQKYLALADNSTALESMVDKQQSKIIELVLMMHNQTDFINRLEEKSERLEQQNRQLHEVLLNQSNMMSELVKGMKYMKEEQDKLKTTVTQPLPLTTQDPKISADKKDRSANTDPPNVRDNAGKNVEKSEDNQNLNKSNIADVELNKAIGEDESKLEKTVLSPENCDSIKKPKLKSNAESIDEIKSLSGQKDEMVKPEVKQPDEGAVPTKKSKSTGKKSSHKVVIPDTPKYFSQMASGPRGNSQHNA